MSKTKLIGISLDQAEWLRQEMESILESEGADIQDKIRAVEFLKKLKGVKKP